MRHFQQITIGVAIATATCLSMLGCARTQGGQPDLESRAYIVSRDSDDVAVIDLDRLEIIGRVKTAGIANHMAELNGDFTKLYVVSDETGETIVVDTVELAVTTRIATAGGPTHVSLSRDGALLAVMNEHGNAVSFIDPATDVVVKRLPGFYTPHFMRFSHDGRFGYVANIGAFHLTRVDMASLEIVDHIALDGFAGPPGVMMAPAETGFADAQIDPDGLLYAAHARTARVLVYDTVGHEKVAEHAVGPMPWIAYAEHPFHSLPRRQLVPSFGDQSVALLRGGSPVMRLAAGDLESFGVNYSPLVPNKAFVMNRVHGNVTVVDTEHGSVTNVIPTGGNTETASTTPDGRWIVATVSGSNQVIVIDAVTDRVVKTFDDVGRYPWSVTIPRGQNYCH